MKANQVNSAVLALLLILLTACSVEPEPLQFGKDGCHHCKMTLMDNKFGAEILTHKGKIYKFDDINCMLSFYHSDKISTDEIKSVLVVDFAKTEKLVDATSSFYVKSEAIKSPMASNIAAFASKEDLDNLNKNWNGQALSWNQLQTQSK
jgi:copper chaperone NosL